MQLRVTLAALLVIASAVVLWPRDDSDIRAGADALARAEQAAREHRSATPAELTDVPFDRLVVAHGLSTADELRQAVGLDWDRAEELEYHCCEPAPIWAFVDDDAVVAYFRPSSEIGYGDEVRPGSYGRNERLTLLPPPGAHVLR